MIRLNSLRVLLALAIPLTTLAPFASSVALAAQPDAVETEARPVATPVKVDARFQRYILAPNGRVTALVLHDGTIVHVRSHAADEPVANLRGGEALHIEGGLVKTPTGSMVTRAVVQQGGKVISDGSQAPERRERGQHRKGEGGKRAPLQDVVATARITQIVAGPRGHVHAVLLDDGTSAMGAKMDELGLKVGDRVTVAGKGGAYAQGKAMRINTITLASGEVRTLPKMHRHHGRKGPPPAGAPT